VDRHHAVRSFVAFLFEVDVRGVVVVETAGRAGGVARAAGADVAGAAPVWVRTTRAGTRGTARVALPREAADVDVARDEPVRFGVEVGRDDPALGGSADRRTSERHRQQEADEVGDEARREEERAGGDEEAAVDQFVRWDLAGGQFLLDTPQGVTSFGADQQRADEGSDHDQQDDDERREAVELRGRDDEQEGVQQRYQQQHRDNPEHTPRSCRGLKRFSCAEAECKPLSRPGRSRRMDQFAAETKVEWREWGPSAFEAAREAGQPILLALTVPWSPECREMDRETYAEPRIAANVNDGFVPVRVDGDRHPEVRERYTMGGFPSTVFLTPAGTVLTGATYLGPDGFRGILDSVRETWNAQGESAGSVPRSLQTDAPPGGEVTPRIEELMVEQLLAAYDESYGGWGTDVKFPLPRTVEFALVRARDQATRTLEAIRTHLRDTDDGGFYRYANGRKWSQARTERLLDENAALVRAFAHGYRYTGEDAYRETAEHAIDYLTTDLWVDVEGTSGAFAGSQAGDDQYHQLDASDRVTADAPFVDETVYADRNGLAVDALCTYAAYTDDERARRYAERARDTIGATLVDGGAVTHYRTDGETGPTGLLLDQARVLQGLTTSWQVLGEGGPAEAVADWTIDHLQVDSGAFRDGPADGPGLCSRSQYPLDATVELADALLDLAALTDDDRYRGAAHDAVAAFAGAADRMGVEVAHYAATAARFLDQSVLRVGPAAGSDLHRAALRLADHETVVVPDVGGDEATLVRNGEPVGSAASPADLEAVLTDER